MNYRNITPLVRMLCLCSLSCIAMTGIENAYAQSSELDRIVLPAVEAPKSVQDIQLPALPPAPVSTGVAPVAALPVVPPTDAPTALPLFKDVPVKDAPAGTASLSAALPAGSQVPEVSLPAASPTRHAPPEDTLATISALPRVPLVQPDPQAIPAQAVDSQPASDVPANAQPDASEVPVPTLQASLPAASDNGKNWLSIGSFGVSLMYSDEDISNLKQVLEVYESAHANPVMQAQTGEKTEADLLAELLRAGQSDDQKEPELTALPTFYVGALIFPRNADWSIWINGELLNRKHSDSASQHIRVVGVARDNVAFAWKPENLAQAYQRYQAVKEQSKPATVSQAAQPEAQAAAALTSATAVPPKRDVHREARSGSIEFDKDNGEFVVRMRPNQTFMAETMQLFEGKLSTAVARVLQSPADGGLAAAPDNAAAAASGQTASAAPAGTAGQPMSGTTDERALANQMLKNLQNLTNPQGIAGMVQGLAGAAAAPQPQAQP